MIPTGRLTAAGAILLLLSIAASLSNMFFNIWLAAGMLFVLAVLFDLLICARYREPVLERHFPSVIPVGRKAHIKLVLHITPPVPSDVQLFDSHPENWTTEGLPIHSRRIKNKKKSVKLKMNYILIPNQRGRYSFYSAQIRFKSPLSLWKRCFRPICETSFKVYPDFASISGYKLLTTLGRQNNLGIRKKSRRGQGIDFHQLREFREGDSLRTIDWKSSSKYRELITKEYQDAEDQQIMFLLDCGNRMRAVEEGLSHFDHCLNGMLLVSFIALKQNDSVGFATYGGRNRKTPPVKGPHALRHLMNTSFDLTPSFKASDPREALEYAAGALKRRTLFVMLGKFDREDYVNIQMLTGILKKKHLLLVVNMLEKEISLALEQTPDTQQKAFTAAGAAFHMEQITKAKTGLASRNMIMADACPHNLPVTLVNEYFKIKRTGLL